MDERNNTQPRRAEPGFGHDAPSHLPDDSHVTAPGAPVLYAETGDMPSWLKEPAQPSGGWKRTAALWTGSLVALAVVFAGSMWLFEEHKADSAMRVVATRSGAAVAPAPAPAGTVQDKVVPSAPSPAPVEQRKVSKLPPLVLLEPAPPKRAQVAETTQIDAATEPGAQTAAIAPAPARAAKPADPVPAPVAKMAPPALAVAAKQVSSDADGVAGRSATTAVLTPNASVKVPAADRTSINAAPVVATRPSTAPAPVAREAVRTEPVIANVAPKETAPTQLAKAAAVKPAAPKAGSRATTVARATTPAQRRQLMARNIKPTSNAKVAARVKKPVPAKRPVTVLARAETRPVAGITLPPARQFREEPVPIPAPIRAPLPGRCQPGELARECAARLGVR